MNLIRLIACIVFLCLFVCTGGGCRPGFQPGVFTDDLGREVRIEKVPQRIISLAPSHTEILFALGLEERVIGVTDFCDYPPEALEKEKVGGPWTPDVEKIVALQPDLILASDTNPLDIITTLEGLELTVFGIEATDLDDLLDDIRTVVRITDKEAEADALTAEMRTRIDAAKTRIQFFVNREMYKEACDEYRKAFELLQ